MKLNEQPSIWTDTDKEDYIVKKQDSNNFEVQIVKKNGKDVYQYRKKTQSSTTTPSLPNWVPDCLKNEFGDLKPTNDTPPTQVVRVQSKSKWYFEKTISNKNRFIYLDLPTNKKIYGTWECQSDGNVFIKTNDGEQYSTKDNEWVEQPLTSSSTPQKKRGNSLKPEEYKGIEFKYKYPNDKNYIYGVKGGDWYAKNVNNQKVFNISKDGFQSSVENLNKQFPNALDTTNNVGTEESNNQTNTQGSTNNSTTTPSNDQSNVKPVTDKKLSDYKTEVDINSL